MNDIYPPLIPNETPELRDLYNWLQAKAQEVIREWYGNPLGSYSGHIVADIGHTRWAFSTGSGWSEPRLIWYIANDASLKSSPKQNSLKTPRGLVWYDRIYSHNHELLDVEESIQAVLKLADSLKQAKWKDSRDT